MPIVDVPPAMRHLVTAVWGDDGRRWLAGLPALVAGIMRDWQLEAVAPLPPGINWVAAVRRADATAAVLKLGVPEAGHIALEGHALAAFDGAGAVRLLDRDDTRGALLLERAEPGTPVAALVPARDADATAVLIAAMKRLHRPAPPGSPLPALDVRGGAFARHLRRFPNDGPLPRHLVNRAARLFGELCASATERVVLHGDLHHGNVLAAGREPWLAIDPHGLVGDPGYDVGALLYNPDPARTDDVVQSLLPARVEQLADGLGMPVDRVVAWGFAQAVLAEVWAAEDGSALHGGPLRTAVSLLPRLS